MQGAPRGCGGDKSFLVLFFKKEPLPLPPVHPRAPLCYQGA
jgi:hypothetical protein